jgi:hypothetical protein
VLSQQTKSDSKAESTAETGAVKVPAIALPKGGGAIRGLGGNFAANPVTGTDSMSCRLLSALVALALDRNFRCRMTLAPATDPSAWAGVSCSLPYSRNTDKGLPPYNDADESEPLSSLVQKTSCQNPKGMTLVRGLGATL